MANQNGRRRRLPVWKYLLFLVVLFFLFLASLELGARVLVLFYKDLSLEKKRIVCHDLVMHHAWVPSRTSIDDNRSIPFKLVVNSQGWPEEYEVSKEKPAGVFRIFYLGDSNTQGVVDKEHKMVKLVEKKLNERNAPGVKYEVINTGTSSYSFLQYYLLSKKIMDYSPDMVVINVDMTDVVNNTVYMRTVVRDESGDIVAVRPDLKSKYIMTPHGFVRYNVNEGWKGFLEKYSDFCFFVSKYISVYVNKESPPEDKGGDWMCLNWTDKINKNVDDALKILETNVEFLKKRGVRVMVTGVPNYNQYTGAASARPHDELAALCKRLNVPYLNSYKVLEPKIKGTPKEEFYWSTDPSHFNIQGNKIWAEAQSSFISDPTNGLLPVGK